MELHEPELELDPAEPARLQLALRPGDRLHLHLSGARRDRAHWTAAGAFLLDETQLVPAPPELLVGADGRVDQSVQHLLDERARWAQLRLLPRGTGQGGAEERWCAPFELAPPTKTAGD